MTAEARPSEDGTIMRDSQSRVPVRTIAATIGMVLLTAAVLLLGWEVRRVLTWIVVAALLAIILGPLVDIAQRRLHLRRALATLLVFLVAIIALAGILTMFIRPLANEGPQFIDRVPSYVEQARTGRGPVGNLVQRYNLDEYLQRNQARLRESANRLTTPALGVLRSIFSTVVALVTIFVLTFLMVVQGPKLLSAWVSALPERRQERVRRVAADCAKAVTGYMTGNLVISVIAGTVTYVVLWIMGVPYRGVVALFVGFADLIPLVGATLGAVVAIAVAALHSLPAAIVVLVVFVVYQQLENHVLQPVIMSRTVQLSALTVLVSILIGVELFGFLGALLAIPVAGCFMSSAVTCMTATAAASSPNRPPGPTRSRCRSPDHSNPASRHPLTSPPPQTADPIRPATQAAPTPRWKHTAPPEGISTGGTYGPR
jgi:predicted PurR-regulated permease PerM